MRSINYLTSQFNIIVCDWIFDFSSKIMASKFSLSQLPSVPGDIS